MTPNETDSNAATKPHIRGSMLMLAGRAIGVILNFATQVITVRYLSEADYGAFAYAFALMMFGSHVAGMGLEKGVSRFVPIQQERRQYGRMGGTVAFALGAIVGVGVGLAALVFAFHGFIGARLVPDPLALSLLLILICMAPLQALDNLAVKLFAIFATPRALFFRRHVLTPGLRVSAVLALVVFAGDAVFLASAYLVSGVLAATISGLILARVLRDQDLLRYLRPRNLEMSPRSLLGFSVPLLSSDIVTAMRNTLVVFLLGLLQSSVSVAAYRAVFPVARLNLMVFDGFRLLFEPAAARLYARGDRAAINELYWRSASWIVACTFPILAVSFSFARPTTVLLFGERYADSAPILALLAVGYFVNASFGFNAVTLRVLGQVRTLVTIDCLVVAIALPLHLLLIPRLGALGAAMVSCAVLIGQNVLYQLALIRSRAVRPVDVRFLRVIATVVALSAALWAIQLFLAPPLYVGLGLLVLASLLVFWITGPDLDVDAAFPELSHIPILRRLLRAPSPADPRDDDGPTSR